MDSLLNAANAANTRKEIILDISPLLDNNRFESDESYEKLYDGIPVLAKFKDLLCLKRALSNRVNDVMDEYIKFIYTHIGLLYEAYDKVIIKNEDSIILHITANRSAKGFEGLADYSNTAIGNGFRTDADKIVMCDDDYGVVELHKSMSIDGGTFPNMAKQLIVIRHNGRPYDNMKFIPYSGPSTKFPILKGAVSEKPFIVSADEDTLCVSGECTIRAKVPIITESKVTIMGTQGSILHLINTEGQQPCIGPVTRTNMSGGRWSPEGKCPDEIIIDGVHVICESEVDGFTIGQYGDLDNKIPKITLINGGKITCPEMEGERVVARKACAPSGSTKIYEPMVYNILHINQRIEDLYSPEKKDLIEEVESILGRKVSTICLQTSENALRNAIKWLKINPRLNPDFYLNGENESDLYIKKCMMLLGMPDELFESKEIFFEMYNKHDFICNVFYGGSKSELMMDMYTAVKFLASTGLDNPYIREVMYDMIPAYNYQFLHSGEHYDDVLNFLEVHKDSFSETRYIEIEKHRQDILVRYSL